MRFVPGAKDLKGPLLTWGHGLLFDVLFEPTGKFSGKLINNLTQWVKWNQEMLGLGGLVVPAHVSWNSFMSGPRDSHLQMQKCVVFSSTRCHFLQLSDPQAAYSLTLTSMQSLMLSLSCRIITLLSGAEPLGLTSCCLSALLSLR